MDEQGFSSGLSIAEKRYDAVLHMVTAAEGAEEFYNFSNEARFELADAARARDQRLRHAYLGHHHHIVIDNRSPTFEDKVNETMRMISSVVGLPTDSQLFKKYLISGDMQPALPDGVSTE